MIILFGKKSAELITRLNTIEQTLKRLEGLADDVFSEAARASESAKKAELSSSIAGKAQQELSEVLKKVVAETPALPFERANATLGRVSAIRHQLRLMEERSGS